VNVLCESCPTIVGFEVLMAVDPPRGADVVHSYPGRIATQQLLNATSAVDASLRFHCMQCPTPCRIAAEHSRTDAMIFRQTSVSEHDQSHAGPFRAVFFWKCPRDQPIVTVYVLRTRVMLCPHIRRDSPGMRAPPRIAWERYAENPCPADRAASPPTSGHPRLQRTKRGWDDPPFDFPNLAFDLKKGTCIGAYGRVESTDVWVS
jgi:hypothetical protein